VNADKLGNIYIADTDNQRIRKVAANGIITTVAGDGKQGYSGDSDPSKNLTVLARQSSLNSPQQAIPDAAGNLYISDFGNNRIRKVATDGTIFTFAGTGVSGFAGEN